MLNAAWIRSKRIALQLSVTEAAELAGFAQPQQWSNLEGGQSKYPRLDTLMSVAVALGCSIDELVVKPKRNRGGK